MRRKGEFSKDLTDSIEIVISRLDLVKKFGDHWMARCPAHGDKNPSLSIRETPDGIILLHCFAGCPTENVVSAIGLQMSDLFPSGPRKITELKEYYSTNHRLNLYKEIYHELWVLIQYICARIDALGSDYPRGQKYRHDLKAEMLLPWDRELMAAKRLLAGLGVIYAGKKY